VNVGFSGQYNIDIAETPIARGSSRDDPVKQITCKIWLRNIVIMVGSPLAKPYLTGNPYFNPK
jgi:hypothetical protein